MQSYANHTKWDAKWHFFVLPVLLLNIGFKAWEMIETEISPFALWDVVASIALLLAGYGARMYALKVQDRLIRLEERLRLERVLPEHLRARIGDLALPQLIALRFAGDDELPALVEEALKTGMGSKQIKQAIKHWRPDEFRV